MADQKKQEMSNGEFKTAPLGFDKNEVMAYIVQHNKARKALQEELDALKRSLQTKENEAASASANEEIERKKAELDAQMLECRKQVLDERRKLAQVEKQLHTLEDQYAALSEEFKEYKAKAGANTSGGAVNEQQLAEISAKATADANEVKTPRQYLYAPNILPPRYTPRGGWFWH